MPTDDSQPNPKNGRTWIAAAFSALLGAAAIARAVTQEKPSGAGRERATPARAGGAGIPPGVRGTATGAMSRARPATGTPAVTKVTPAPVGATEAPAPSEKSHHPPEVVLHPGWSRPRPATLPQPTYWPAIMGLGLMFLFWGLVTSVVLSAVGLVIFGIALAGWIGDLRHDS